MKFIKKHLYFIVLTLILFLGNIILNSNIALGAEKKNIIVDNKNEVQQYISNKNSTTNEDNDKLFEGYLSNLFYENNKKANDFETSDLGILNDKERILYIKLKNIITEIADGKRNTTEFTIDLNFHMHYEDSNKFTKEEVAQFFFANKLNVGKIVDLLVYSCSYELYWCDKIKGISSEKSWSCKLDISQEEYNIFKADFTLYSITFKFQVASNYAQDAENNQYDIYRVDASKAKRAQAAKTKADNIVDKYESLGDYEKLYAYLCEICNLTEYNTVANNLGSNKIGTDPWQLVYVFDGDNTTNVVCEGYSKAFAYLFEKSNFKNDIKCYIVSGTSEVKGDIAGNHMWNIVTMEDGKNYIVDVTNCDDNGIGEPDMLFLAGLSGSVEEGYTFIGNNQHVVYFKYNDKIKALYPKTMLELSDRNYFEKQEQKKLIITEILDKTYGDSDFKLSSTGGSGDGIVTYSVPENNGILSINGNTASIIGAGKVLITAVKAGNSTYNSAKATYELTVAKKELIPSISGKVTTKYDNTLSVYKVVDNTLEIKLDGILEIDANKINATATFMYENADIGDNKKIIAKNIILSGDSAKKYVLSSDTVFAYVGKIESSETIQISTPTLVPSVKKVKAVKKKIIVKENQMLDVDFKVMTSNNKKVALSILNEIKATIKNKKIAKAVKTKVNAGKVIVTVKGLKKGATTLKLNIGGKTAKTTIKVQ